MSDDAPFSFEVRSVPESSRREILRDVTRRLDGLTPEERQGQPREVTLRSIEEKIALLDDGPYLDWLVTKGLDDWIDTEQRAQALLVTLEMLTKERG